MSWTRCQFSDCDHEGDFAGAGPFPGGGSGVYAVAWRCGICGTTALDVCPAGPQMPRGDACLNCGTDRPADTCPACGVAAGEIEARVAAAHGGPGDTLVEAAHACAGRGLLRLAFNMLDLRLCAQPGDRAAWQAKGALLQQLGLYEASIVPVERAIEGGAPRRMLISLGCALDEVGRHTDAITAYQRFLDSEPEPEWIAAALANQANSLSHLDELERAAELLSRAIALEPERAVFHMNLAILEKRRRAPAGALAALDSALEYAAPPERPRILHLRADTLCELKRPQEALQDIDEALADSADRAARMYVRGWALGLLGRLEEAREALEQVLAHEPEHAAAKRAIGIIEQALAEQGGRRS